jgi:hypothetical protein
MERRLPAPQHGRCVRAQVVKHDPTAGVPAMRGITGGRQ